MSKKFLILSAIGLLAVVLIVTAGNFVWQITRSVNIKEADRKFSITSGQTANEVSRALAQRGLVKSDYWFRIYVWIRRAENKFIAGDFTLPARLSSAQLADILTSLKSRPVRAITIPEGWTIRDIAVYFENQGLFQQEELTELVGLPGVFASANNDFYNELAAQYRPLVYRTAAAPLEGYLFPDTYEIFADATVKDAVTKMVANFDQKLSQDLRDEIDRQGKSLYNVLIMASLIEAEVPHEEDRPIVADIFWTRLERGVPLQSDATLKYIIGGKRPALTAEELKIDSVYNTYKNKGLPPTPIGNPGLSAIKAAIYPSQTDYFYFLSTPDGQTIFSKTLDEHNANKAKYLRP